MKKHIFFLSLCLSCNTSTVFAQWQKMSGPSHYFATGIAHYGQTQYTSSRQALYTRPLNDNIWQPVVDTPANFYPGEFFQIGDTLFTHSLFGLYRSNNGVSWENVTPQPNRLIYYRTAGSSIFAIERTQLNCRVYRSPDKGATWDTVLTMGNLSQINFWGKVKDSLCLIEQQSPGPVKFFKSGDEGQTWQEVVPNNLPSNGYGIIQIGDRLCIPSGSGVYFSDDGGINWIFSNNGLLTGGISIALYNRGDVIFLQSQVQNTPIYYRSTDNGVSWTQIAADLSAYSDLFATADAVYLVADFNKLYRSADDGATWALANFPAESDFRPTYIWQSGTRVALYGEGGIYTSNDNGLNWNLDRSGILPYELNVQELTKQGGYLFAATNAGVFRSDDHAESWQLLQNGLPQLPSFFTFRKQMLATSSVVLMTTPFGSFRSNNSGNNWQMFDLGGQGEPDLFASKGDAIYALTYSDKLFRSTTNGVSWDFLSTLPTFGYSFILATETAIVCGSISKYYVSDENGLVWSEKNYTGLTGLAVTSMTANAGKYYAGGASSGNLSIGVSENLERWTKINVDPTGPGRQCFEILATDDIVIAPFVNRGVYLSKDESFWVKSPNDNPLLDNIYTLETDGQFVYAGTAFYGVWRIPMNYLLGLTNQSDVAASDITLRLYPNPTRESAALEYELLQATEVVISLYDFSGKEIAVLARGRRESGPVQENICLPPGLPAGNYCLNIHTALGKGAVQFAKD